MWKVYKWDGHYIMGELVSKHSTESAALKAAKKSIKFKNIRVLVIKNKNL